jgi:SAM-dependent methyltransferase
MAATPTDWAGDRAARWIRSSAQLTGQLAPVADLLFAAARLAPGERVVDVGCGTGPTTWRAAAEVGPGGAVTGLDVAGPMLAAAAQASPPVGAAPVEWVEADATTWSPGGPPFDVVLSRFGVMFFADPPAAFANLHRSAAPDGRLVAAVWAAHDRSPLFARPLAVALAALRDLGLDPTPPEPDQGAFSLSDPDHVHRLLAGAGWHAVTVEEHPLTLALGGGLPPAAAAEASTEFGPTRVVTDGLEPDVRQQVVDALTEAYATDLDGHGHVALDAVPVLVTARA